MQGGKKKFPEDFEGGVHGMSQVCIFIGTRAHTVLSPRSLLQVLGALSPLQLTGGSTRPAVENVENVESQASPRCFPRKDAKTGVILKRKQSCGQLSVLPLHFHSLNCLFPHLLHNLFATGQERQQILSQMPVPATIPLLPQPAWQHVSGLWPRNNSSQAWLCVPGLLGESRME